MSFRDMGLSPVIKWTGGKEQELKYILPNMPTNISRFIEDGQNNIVYCPNDHLIKVYVELVEKYSHTTGTREKSDEQG